MIYLSQIDAATMFKLITSNKMLHRGLQHPRTVAMEGWYSECLVTTPVNEIDLFLLS